MAQGIDWPGANHTLGAPTGMEQLVQPLRVFATMQLTVSCWQLTDEELTEIVANGGKVYVSVMYGRGGQPPMFVGSENSVREVATDYGQVWRRGDVRQSG